MADGADRGEAEPDGSDRHPRLQRAVGIAEHEQPVEHRDPPQRQLDAGGGHHEHHGASARHRARRRTSSRSAATSAVANSAPAGTRETDGPPTAGCASHDRDRPRRRDDVHDGGPPHQHVPGGVERPGVVALEANDQREAHDCAGGVGADHHVAEQLGQPQARRIAGAAGPFVDATLCRVVIRPSGQHQTVGLPGELIDLRREFGGDAGIELACQRHHQRIGVGGGDLGSVGTVLRRTDGRLACDEECTARRRVHRVEAAEASDPVVVTGPQRHDPGLLGGVRAPVEVPRQHPAGDECNGRGHDDADVERERVAAVGRPRRRTPPQQPDRDGVDEVEREACRGRWHAHDALEDAQDHAIGRGHREREAGHDHDRAHVEVGVGLGRHERHDHEPHPQPGVHPGCDRPNHATGTCRRAGGRCGCAGTTTNRRRRATPDRSGHRSRSCPSARRRHRRRRCVPNGGRPRPRAPTPPSPSGR